MFNWSVYWQIEQVLRLSDIFIKVYTGELCTQQAFTSESHSFVSLCILTFEYSKHSLQTMFYSLHKPRKQDQDRHLSAWHLRWHKYWRARTSIVTMLQDTGINVVTTPLFGVHPSLFAHHSATHLLTARPLASCLIPLIFPFLP